MPRKRRGNGWRRPKKAEKTIEKVPITKSLRKTQKGYGKQVKDRNPRIPFKNGPKLNFECLFLLQKDAFKRKEMFFKSFLLSRRALRCAAFGFTDIKLFFYSHTMKIQVGVDTVHQLSSSTGVKLVELIKPRSVNVKINDLQPKNTLTFFANCQSFKSIEIDSGDVDAQMYIGCVKPKHGTIKQLKFHRIINLPNLSKLPIDNLEVTTNYICPNLNLCKAIPWKCKSVNFKTDFNGLFFCRLERLKRVNTTTTHLTVNRECRFDHGFFDFLERMDSLKHINVTSHVFWDSHFIRKIKKMVEGIEENDRLKELIIQKGLSIRFGRTACGYHNIQELCSGRENVVISEEVVIEKQPQKSVSFKLQDLDVEVNFTFKR